MTTAIMDSLDAQMADYQNDFDVPMHISSSDAWLQDVAPMEDDAQLAFQSKVGTTDTTPTVEVDMEAYIDDGHIEYDMVDDHSSHNSASGELLDVDVLPASTMQSPFVAVTTLPSVEYAPHSVSTPHSNSVPLVSEKTPEPSTIIDPTTLTDPNITSDPQANTPLPEVEQLSDKISTPEAVVLHELQKTDHITIPTTPSELPSDQTDMLHATNSTVLSFHSETDEVAAHDLVVLSEKDTHGGPSHLHSEQETMDPETTSNADIQASHDQLTRSHVVLGQISEPTSGVLDSKPYVDDAEPFIVQDPLFKATPLEADGETSVEERPPSPQEKEASVVQSTEESAEVSNEPPEEVYLEVPPPILLAIFSNDQPELCLFNKVSEPLPNEDGSQERHILLQASPGLYYEPLVHVFEALRQDEYISTVLEVSGNELALEAYDLDLAITEDNFYAREISLHDFHFLHTSANIAGSLRLRLYISGPRFIIRYHALQALLNLHLDDPRDSKHSEIEKPLDEHEDRELYAQEETSSAAENASTFDRRRLDPSRDIPDQPEEGGHELVVGYHEASHTASEGTVTEPGEIDLSTLPPFIDSPEAHEEDAEQEGEYAEEVLYHTTTTPDHASTGDYDTQDDGQSSEEQENEGKENEEQESEEQENEEQESGEQENEEGGNYEEQESNQSVRTEESSSSRNKSAAVMRVNIAGNEEIRTFEENVDDGLQTSNIVEGSENRDPPREITENPHQLEQNEGDEYEYLPVEPTDKNQHQEGDNQGIPFEVSVDTYQEAEVTADKQEVEGLDETWDDELDGEGDPDTTWEAEAENLDESISNESSVTLSSKTSKRSYNESGLEHSDEENCGSESPGAKRVRVV